MLAYALHLANKLCCLCCTTLPYALCLASRLWQTSVVFAVCTLVYCATVPTPSGFFCLQLVSMATQMGWSQHECNFLVWRQLTVSVTITVARYPLNHFTVGGKSQVESPCCFLGNVFFLHIGIKLKGLGGTKKATKKNKQKWKTLPFFLPKAQINKFVLPTQAHNVLQNLYAWVSILNCGQKKNLLLFRVFLETGKYVFLVFCLLLSYENIKQ